MLLTENLRGRPECMPAARTSTVSSTDRVDLAVTTATNAVGNHLRENRSGREKLKVDPKTKEVDTFITIASRNWELFFAYAGNKRECQHLSMSKQIMHMLRHQKGFHEDDGDVQWRKVMDNLRREEQARDRNHQDQQRASSYSTDKPRFDVCKIDGELTHIRAIHGNSGKPSVGPSYFDMRVIPKKTLEGAFLSHQIHEELPMHH